MYRGRATGERTSACVFLSVFLKTYASHKSACLCGFMLRVCAAHYPSYTTAAHRFVQLNSDHATYLTLK